MELSEPFRREREVWRLGPPRPSPKKGNHGGFDIRPAMPYHMRVTFNGRREAKNQMTFHKASRELPGYALGSFFMLKKVSTRKYVYSW